MADPLAVLQNDVELITREMEEVAQRLDALTLNPKLGELVLDIEEGALLPATVERTCISLRRQAETLSRRAGLKKKDES